MKNLLLKVTITFSVLIGFSSFASAVDMCRVDNLQVGDELSIYVNLDEEIIHFERYFVTDRQKHPTENVPDLIVIKGASLRNPERKLISHVFCEDNTLIINWIISIEKGVRQTHNKKYDHKYIGNKWKAGKYLEGADAWLEITKKTSLASN